MTEDTTKTGDHSTSNINLVLGPKGITLDNSGRITFNEPEILHAVVTSTNSPSGVESGPNFYNCGCNTSGCGKPIKSVDEDED